jgi:hypothetical protein
VRRQLCWSGPRTRFSARTGSHTNAVEERGFGGRAEKPVNQVAGLGEHRRQHNEPVVALSKPVPAPNVMGIAAIRQRNQHVRIDNDHKPRTLPAEPLRQQLIDAFGEIRPPAIPDADKRGQPRGLLVARSVLENWPEEFQRTRRLLLAKIGDELLQLLLRGHLSSVSTMISPPATNADGRVDCAEARTPGTATGH